ncbi:prepilin-type N-terminal cleavage/methylation domain-containing protein [Dyella monticola]|uniref:Type II secretion system protein H n=1 Tax=Dyella monticola TaxID=1927958 RepID=A0A370X8G2_9GAMM|nr:GspH/FimT family pseudopilin [Dyella monticola]RDS84678.1 prepilin-type N-terminal cleavage/methylation domain-containing protein [Dyella monticola]
MGWMKPDYVSKAAWGSHQGFGLVEQIATLAVLAVAMAMAVPAFHRLAQSHELRVAQSDYIAALQHARSVAVNEQARMIFCATRDAHTCSGEDTWNQGWLIGRADPARAGQLVGPPRYAGRGYHDRLVITSNSGKKYIWFGPDGTAVNTFATLSFCVKDDPQRVLLVVITRVGRVRGEQGKSTDAPCAAALE